MHLYGLAGTRFDMFWLWPFGAILKALCGLWFKKTKKKNIVFPENEVHGDSGSQAQPKEVNFWTELVHGRLKPVPDY